MRLLPLALLLTAAPAAAQVDDPPPDSLDGEPLVLDVAFAAPGDTVVVVHYAVQAERQADFEDAVAALMAALTDAAGAGTLAPEAEAAYAMLRVLYPAAAADDGTLPYVFVFEPAPTASADVAALVAAVPDDARDARLHESLARPPVRLVVTPSGY
ncbi:MAG TPA: hypothetical protein VD962_07410 [Rubricoccaceae bacterium]|nr:hypothetical protein [Rubricoccaceae bacterium]